MSTEKKIEELETDGEKLCSFVSVDEDAWEEYMQLSDESSHIFDDFLIKMLRMPSEDKKAILYFLKSNNKIRLSGWKKVK